MGAVFPGRLQFAALDQATNIPAYYQAQDQILEYDCDHYMGGRLGRAGNRAGCDKLSYHRIVALLGLVSAKDPANS
ncbi:hypothetical protein EG329_011890 [Mollisiaceae sp. DMI_Dod_QoI]|nr:hypothetical protein EG329_011890 [Helotiales sp. DMI_Dod_QoI]